jgi:hypothetical protein
MHSLHIVKNPKTPAITMGRYGLKENRLHGALPSQWLYLCHHVVCYQYKKAKEEGVAGAFSKETFNIYSILQC